jgi:hypothetical protein
MEPMTREEMQEAQRLWSAYIEAKETFVGYVIKLKDKFLATGVGPDLLPDWIRFAKVAAFLLQKDAALEKQLKEAGEAMQTKRESGWNPLVRLD